MISAILLWYHGAKSALANGALYRDVMKMETLVKIARMKYEPEENWKNYIAELFDCMKSEFSAMSGGDVA